MKKVVITGANKGIGLALVNEFLHANFYVIATTRNHPTLLIEHPNLEWISLEITSEDSIEHAIKVIKTHHQNIDLLINNAGVGLDLDQDIPQIDTIRNTFEVNVFGLINFTERIIGSIIAGGTIFNISSVMGMLNRAEILPNATAYRMSKAALNMYTKTLAARLEPNHIRVVAIHPGWVQTDMGGEEADITPETSAAGIYKLYSQSIESNSFWAAETQTKLNW